MNFEQEGTEATERVRRRIHLRFLLFSRSLRAWERTWGRSGASDGGGLRVGKVRLALVRNSNEPWATTSPYLRPSALRSASAERFCSGIRGWEEAERPRQGVKQMSFPRK